MSYILEAKIVHVGKINVPDYVTDKDEKYEYMERNWTRIGFYETEPDYRDRINAFM